MLDSVPGGSLLMSLLPVGSSVSMLIAIVLLEEQFRSLLSHPRALALASIATALSTPLLYANTGYPTIDSSMFFAGALLTGFGSGPLWIMWGEFYACITQEESEFLAPVSALAAAFCVLLVSAMDGWIAIAFVTCLPLLSGLCLALSRVNNPHNEMAGEYAVAPDSRAHDAAHAHARQNLTDVFRSMSRTGIGILAACFFVCIEGSFYESPNSTHSYLQASIVVTMALMLIIGFSITRRPRRVSLSFLYRWMCPILIAGFGAVIVLGPQAGGGIALVVSVAARFIFCLVTQMYFARYAIIGVATPVQSYGLGWIFVHLGDFLGIVAADAISSGILANDFTVDQAIAVCVIALVAIVMLVLGDSSALVPGKTCCLGSVHHTPTTPDELNAESESETPSSADEIDERIRELAQLGALTPRETEVFALLARGRSIPYVRDALVISRETAATHAKHIYAKLNVHSRQELIDLVIPPTESDF